MSNDPNGLYKKFEITDARTGDNHEGRDNFVMFFDDPECRQSLIVYALGVAGRNPRLANEMLAKLHPGVGGPYHGGTWVEAYRMAEADNDQARQDQIAELKANQCPEEIEIHDSDGSNVVAKIVRYREEGYGGSYDEPGYPAVDFWHFAPMVNPGREVPE